MADTRFSTPIGTAVYPRLKTPDTKFDELGIYKADIAIPLVDAEPLMAQLQALHKAHTGKAAAVADNTMWTVENDDSGQPTGRVIFKLRVKNRLNKKGELWDRRPKLFDAALKPVDVNPWGGSKLVVSFDVYEWIAGVKKGVSLQPVGVQIIELVSGEGGADASAMGFKAAAGYTAPVATSYDGDEEEVGDTSPADDEGDESGDY